MSHTTGSLSAYYKHGCRCTSCKAIASNYNKSRIEQLTPEQKRARLDHKNQLQRHRRALQKELTND